MILAPVIGDYRISQGFGKNPDMYKPLGYKAHPGQDIAVPCGTPIYSPIEGLALYRDTGSKGWGKYVKITEYYNTKDIPRRQIVLAHLSKFDTKNLKKETNIAFHVKAGQLIGYSGNTGNSTGPHLHWELKRVDNYGTILNYGNGYKGCEDIFEKGWIVENNPSKY